MAIKSIEAPTGIEIVREAATSAANSRNSQQPLGRVPDPAATVAVSVAATAAAAASAAPVAAAIQPPITPTMRIHVDQDTGKTVVALLDPDSGKVLRQMPSDEALQVAKAIGRFQGMFVDLKV
jgi:flagellar protein FlaG